MTDGWAPVMWEWTPCVSLGGFTRTPVFRLRAGPVGVRAYPSGRGWAAQWSPGCSLSPLSVSSAGVEAQLVLEGPQRQAGPREVVASGGPWLAALHEGPEGCTCWGYRQGRRHREEEGGLLWELFPLLQVANKEEHQSKARSSHRCWGLGLNVGVLPGRLPPHPVQPTLQSTDPLARCRGRAGGRETPARKSVRVQDTSGFEISTPLSLFKSRECHVNARESSVQAPPPVHGGLSYN